GWSAAPRIRRALVLAECPHLLCRTVEELCRLAGAMDDMRQEAPSDAALGLIIQRTTGGVRQHVVPHSLPPPSGYHGRVAPRCGLPQRQSFHTRSSRPEPTLIGPN